MLHRAQNWIDGRFVDAASGESYELFADGARTSIGRWPRSGAVDLDRALAGLERAAPDWSRRGSQDRFARLWDAFEALDDDPDPHDHLATALGLTRREDEDLFDATADRFHEWFVEGDRGRPIVAAPIVAGPNVTGPIVHLQEWSELHDGLARDVFRRLYSGGTVLVVSDPRAPMIADEFAHALAAHTDGAFALIHDDGRTVARASVLDPRVAEVHVASTYEGLDELRARAAAPVVRTIDSGFGAGLERTVTVPLVVRDLASVSVVVDEQGDLDNQARAIVDRAFARVPALSGAAPGSVGRVLCPRRVFSRFTEHLLAAVDAHRDVRRPLCVVGRQLDAHLERVFALGHDEGATAIYTGPTAAQRFPLVFTNVEEHMRLARETRPAPVLSLLRVADAARGWEVSQRLQAASPAGTSFRPGGGGGGPSLKAQSRG